MIAPCQRPHAARAIDTAQGDNHRRPPFEIVSGTIHLGIAMVIAQYWSGAPDTTPLPYRHPGAHL